MTTHPPIESPNKMAVHFSSATDLWATPQDLFDRLHAIHGFTLDVCALPENAKCKKYYTPEIDGLKQDWKDNVCWMNPPYGREIGKWVKKAYESTLMDWQHSGAKVVCLLPARTDTDWFQRYILPFAGAVGGDKTKAIYTAGLFDGEGCVFIRKNEATETSSHRSTHYALGIKVTMTHQPTIERLHKIWGVGHITIDSNKPNGHKTSYSWTCMSRDAASVLRAIYPFSVTKRAEIFEAIEFSLMPSQRSGKRPTDPEILAKRHEYYLRLRDLKKESSDHISVSVDLEFIRGRLKFGGHKNSAPFPSAIVVFEPIRKDK